MKLSAADDIVDQHLARRRPQHARKSVDDQQDDGVPFLKAVGRKQDAPAKRDQHEQAHPDLNDPARIEAVGQCAGPDRADQEGHPVGDDRKAC